MVFLVRTRDDFSNREHSALLIPPRYTHAKPARALVYERRIIKFSQETDTYILQCLNLSGFVFDVVYFGELAIVYKIDSSFLGRTSF